MRLSSNYDDRGYAALATAKAAGHCINIYLDGVKQTKVVTVDEEMRFIERHVLDKDGKSQVDPIDRSRVWTQRLTGDVRIEID